MSPSRTLNGNHSAVASRCVQGPRAGSALKNVPITSIFFIDTLRLRFRYHVRWGELRIQGHPWRAKIDGWNRRLRRRADLCPLTTLKAVSPLAARRRDIATVRIGPFPKLR